MKTILVTGGNRGIGLEICKQLKELGHQVILTARNESKGEDAANEIGVFFMKLDVSSPESIERLIQNFEKEYDRLDVLVNNAGVFLDKSGGAANVDFDVVYKTMETNTYGPWRLIIGLRNVLAKSKDPRVINISSGYGSMDEMSGGNPSYRMSKVAMNALTLMMHSEIGDQIAINAMCPGWVRTDMGGSSASRSVEKGAETAVWLVTEDKIPKGKFLRDMKEIAW